MSGLSHSSKRSRCFDISLEALNSMGVNTIRRFARNMWIYIEMELLESWQNT